MTKSVAIIGLGYVGLPLACLCAQKGFKVFGVDINSRAVDFVNSGKSHINDKALSNKVKKLNGKISASTGFAAVKKADAVIVCVPTPVDENFLPDLKPLESACEEMQKNLSKGQLIVVESTVYPGTTEEIVKPILEKSGLVAEKDFFLVHCPERIDPANPKWDVSNIPRVLGGLSPKGSLAGKKFYESIIGAKITLLKSAKEAEAVKVTENTFRDINIAFVNELAKAFAKMGIDITEVIKGASTKPFGYMPFYPGPGVGGHCIAQDPYYLIEKAKSTGYDPKFISLAREINNSMPEFVVSLVQRQIGELKGKTVSVLGLAYKPEVDDLRESPALKIIKLLEKQGAAVNSFDPFAIRKSSCASISDALKNSDCTIVATNHKIFVKTLTPSFLKKAGVKNIVDARNCLDKEKIISQGINYIGIGR
ncbi:MAG: nucleotide sugar dehydrogenase [archaeon]